MTEYMKNDSYLAAISVSAMPVADKGNNQSEAIRGLPRLKSELAAILRTIVEIEGGGARKPSKAVKSSVIHTSQRVRRVSRTGLSGPQEWREYRKEHGTCSPFDGWYILAEVPDVMLVTTWHDQADDFYEPETTTTYVVVDRSKEYKPTTNLKYAVEVFVFACINELLRRLQRLPEASGSQRLARLAKFVRKEKPAAKEQEGRTEKDDEEAYVQDSFSPFSPLEDWSQ